MAAFQTFFDGVGINFLIGAGYNGKILIQLSNFQRVDTVSDISFSILVKKQARIVKGAGQLL